MKDWVTFLERNVQFLGEIEKFRVDD